jgi:reactive intermediate/imine deaminase
MRKNINPKNIGESKFYSHGVLVSSKNLLFTAGQVALDIQGKVIGKGDIEAQTEHIMENLKNILNEAEMDFNDIIKVNMYLVNMDDLPKVLTIRNRYFSPNKPAATGIGIASLVKPELMIEIEIIAAK